MIKRSGLRCCDHDFTRRGKVAQTGFDEAWMTLLVATNPPLAFTHIPLGDVPAGTVNAHGQVHNNEPLRLRPLRQHLCGACGA